jgi:cytochrome P450
MAAVDLEYKDLKVAAGDPLWLLVGHGQQFHADGTRDSFDITAEHRPQLTFGHGAHFCLGAHLARVEMAVALPILADRLPDLELDGEPVWRAELAGFVGAELLPIRFTPIAI